jgi:hypothetical protein
MPLSIAFPISRSKVWNPNNIVVKGEEKKVVG